MKIDKDSMYELIRAWENDAGEGFMDYFDYQLNISDVAEWCLKKNYISSEQFSKFMGTYYSDYTTIDNLLFDQYDFCVYQWKDNTSDEDYYKLEDKAVKVLAEYLSEHKDYIKKVILFSIGKDWSTNYEEIIGESEEQELNRGIKEFKRYYQEYLDDGDIKIEFQ